MNEELRVLLIEDNEDIRIIIKDYFSLKSGGAVMVDCLGEGKPDLIRKPLETCDIILLDIMLPGMDGFELCREIRKTYSGPVIFISALSDESDRLKAYERGADDYVVKPFSVSELFFKVNAWVKRSRLSAAGEETAGDIISYEGITLDIKKRQCLTGEERHFLTYTEFELLRLLVENKEEVLSRETVLNTIWPEKLDVNDRVVDTHIKNLRKDLGPSGEMIKPVRGVGYCLRKQLS